MQFETKEALTASSVAITSVASYCCTSFVYVVIICIIFYLAPPVILFRRRFFNVASLAHFSPSVSFLQSHRLLSFSFVCLSLFSFVVRPCNAFIFSIGLVTFA